VDVRSSGSVSASVLSSPGGLPRRFLRVVDARFFEGRAERYAHLLSRALTGAPSVLDVGCGDQGTLVRTVGGLPYSVGVDIVLPSSSETRQGNQHSEYVRLDIRRLGSHFAPRSFDCVVALDVIEHLPKREGEQLLRDMEQIAKKRVIVLTPNGFLPQPPAPDNPNQEHFSGWRVTEFRRRGYHVLGVNGLKPFRGEYAAIRWRPAGLWYRLSLLSQSVAERYPRLAFHLFCVKDASASQSLLRR